MSLDARLAHRLVPDCLCAIAEPVTNVVLAPERLHHLDPDDRLVGRLGQVSLPRLDHARDREDPVREEVREDGDGWHRERREQRQPGVDRKQDDRCADQHHHALQRLHDAPADEVSHRVDVVRRPRDHLAGCMPVVEGAGKPKIGVVHHPAQPRLDRDADASRRVAADEVEPEAKRCQEQDQAEVREKQCAVVAVDRVVDRPLDQDRDRERQPGEDERAREAERDQAPLLPATTGRGGAVVGHRVRSGGSTSCTRGTPHCVPLRHASGGTRSVASMIGRRATYRPERGSEAVGRRTLPASAAVTAADAILALTDIILMSYTGHMDIERHVQAIQSDLAAAAALGDEASVAAGERLMAAVGSVAATEAAGCPHRGVARTQRPAVERPRRGSPRRPRPGARLHRGTGRSSPSRRRRPATISALASPSAFPRP